MTDQQQVSIVMHGSFELFRSALHKAESFLNSTRSQALCNFFFIIFFFNCDAPQARNVQLNDELFNLTRTQTVQEAR
jgi:hypothetical protein